MSDSLDINYGDEYVLVGATTGNSNIFEGHRYILGVYCDSTTCAVFVFVKSFCVVCHFDIHVL